MMRIKEPARGRPRGGGGGVVEWARVWGWVKTNLGKLKKHKSQMMLQGVVTLKA